MVEIAISTKVVLLTKKWMASNQPLIMPLFLIITCSRGIIYRACQWQWQWHSRSSLLFYHLLFQIFPSVCLQYFVIGNWLHFLFETYAKAFHFPYYNHSTGSITSEQSYVHKAQGKNPKWCCKESFDFHHGRYISFGRIIRNNESTISSSDLCLGMCMYKYHWHVSRYDAILDSSRLFQTWKYIKQGGE